MHLLFPRYDFTIILPLIILLLGLPGAKKISDFVLDPRVRWPISATIVTIEALYGIIGTLYNFCPQWRDKIWAVMPAIFQLSGGAIAGYWAIWQFDKTHRQRDEQFERTTRDQTFSDILDRLTSPEISIRANAVLRLAEFGTTLSVGINDDTTSHGDDYPYFLPASQQLITALTIEKERVVREAIKEAIKGLAEFSKKHTGNNQDCGLLLDGLVRQFVSSNRELTRNFIRVLAEFGVLKASADKRKEDNYRITEESIAVISSLASFCSNETTNRACISSLFSWTESAATENIDPNESMYFKNCVRFVALAMNISDADFKTIVAHTLLNLQMAAEQLIDIRDSLAYTLNGTQSLGRSVDREHMDLSHTFLAGAKLSLADLQSADLSHATMHGTVLLMVNLQAANLDGANLAGSFIGAYIYGIHYISESIEGRSFTPTLFPIDTLDNAELDPWAGFPRSKSLDLATDILKHHLSNKPNLQKLINEVEKREGKAESSLKQDNTDCRL